MRATDFLRDENGDRAIVNGDFALAYDEVGIRQLIESYLSFFLEEWFLDLTIGMPYFQRIFIKNPSLVEVREYYRETLASVPGVKEILSLGVEYIDSAARKAGVNWNVNTDVGEIPSNAERSV